jgi:hypothetical protein
MARFSGTTATTNATLPSMSCVHGRSELDSSDRARVASSNAGIGRIHVRGNTSSGVALF